MGLAQNEARIHTDQDQYQDQGPQGVTEPGQDQSLQDRDHHQEDEEEDAETALAEMEGDVEEARVIAVTAAMMIEAEVVAVDEEDVEDVNT